MSKVYEIDVATMPIEKFSKDGELFKDSSGDWKAIYWNARGNGFIELSDTTLAKLRIKIARHANENNYYHKIR